LDEQISETSDLASKLADLNSKLADYQIVINDHVVAIKGARSMCDEFTKGDVGRLQRMSSLNLYIQRFVLLRFLGSMRIGGPPRVEELQEQGQDKGEAEGHEEGHEEE
jgi:hypothetical protein